MEKACKKAHFDCRFGAAGDMLLAALLHSGLDKCRWLAEIQKIALPADSFQVSFEKVTRAGISAEKFCVHPLHEEEEERSFLEIKEIICRSELSNSAKDLALRIFERLARAESAVHGCDSQEVHFHELGALDSLLDIIGFAVAFDMAAIEQVSCSPLPLGAGEVRTAHGLYPVPAPAVLKILEEAGAAISAHASIPFECLTPTGAAILCELAQHWTESPSFNFLESSGYGAGRKDPALWPNVTRVLIGQAQVLPSSARFRTEMIAVIETNIDDQSPQALAYALEKITESGALDAFVTPALMKKGRSGHLLTVLCRLEDQMKVEETILAETTSIGVRTRIDSRTYAERSFREINVCVDRKVKVKLAHDLQGKIVNIQPEFDDLSKLAGDLQISIKEAQELTISAIRKALFANLENQETLNHIAGE